MQNEDDLTPIERHLNRVAEGAERGEHVGQLGEASGGEYFDQLREPSDRELSGGASAHCDANGARVDQMPPVRLLAKLAAVQAELGEIPKNGFNSFNSYKYATYDDIVGAIRKPLASRGVVMLPLLGKVERQQHGTSGGGNQKWWTRVEMSYRLVDSASGEQLELVWHGEALDTEDKGFGKALTYSAKYLLKCLFMVETGDLSDELDDDGREQQQRERQQRREERGAQRGRGRAEGSARKDSPGSGAPPAAPRPNGPAKALADVQADLGRAGCTILTKDSPLWAEYLKWLRSGFEQALGRDVPKIADLSADDITSAGKQLVSMVRDGSYSTFTTD